MTRILIEIEVPYATELALVAEVVRVDAALSGDEDAIRPEKVTALDVVALQFLGMSNYDYTVTRCEMTEG